MLGLRLTPEPVAPRVKTSNQTEGFSGGDRKGTSAFGRNGKQVPVPWGGSDSSAQSGVCAFNRELRTVVSGLVLGDERELHLHKLRGKRQDMCLC